ncbi:MAG: electron transfer flavoprotein subunit beta/FixA family protein [Candidatus Tectomicrobia bacterium]|nr:electron transfer flavoprotein subunit beta/FixA family protein [Candidatus Tectomicrobia bacterium]
MTMNIVVCVKQVPDYEAPASAYRLDRAAKRFIPNDSVAKMLSLFDEHAIEGALQLREALGGKVTSVCLGPQDATLVLRKTLAMGGDEAILIDEAAWGALNPFVTAHILANAIRKIGDVDLVICGRQASDWDFGIVGPTIAEELGWGAVAVIKGLSGHDGGLRVERLLDDGHEVMELALPAVVTVSSEMNKPRYAPIQKVIQAKRKTVPVWGPAELPIDAAHLDELRGRLDLVDLFIPEIEAKCEIVSGENEADAGEKLALKMRDARLV